MEQDVPFLAEDAQVHFVGMQACSTVMLVLLGVQSHEKASLLRVADTPIIADCPPGAQGAFSRIKPLDLTR